MASEPDNLVLQLLREIRTEQLEIRADTSDTRTRLTRVERHLEEVGESMVTAMGYAAHPMQVTENHGQNFDELRDEITALKRRVTDLEQTRQ